MMTLGPLGFATPWLLAALVALPVLWWLLRAVPPAPVRRRFPGVALLLGLTDERSESDRTPWWLLLMRALAVAALILAFAGPVLNPQTDRAGQGPLLIVADASWASARDWPARRDRISGLLGEAAREGRPVAVATLTEPPADGVNWRSADHWRDRIDAIAPRPWAPDAAAVADWAAALPTEAFETFWLSDGLARDGRAPLLEALEARGTVRVFEGATAPLALRPPRFVEGAIEVTALRAREGDSVTAELGAIGRDPAGREAELGAAELDFAAGAREATTTLSLQPELRNRLTRFQIDAQNTAGAVSLTDDSLSRRQVALIAPETAEERLELLSPMHYLREALAPTADLIDGVGDVDTVLQASPDAIVLADIARLSEVERDMLADWVEDGGLLLRFAGPRLAASDISRAERDRLMPVQLREGGRSVGGVMSWGEPRRIAPFDDDSPFAGLRVPGDVTISSQVLADPGPELSRSTIASLEDGTPLVTRRAIGAGQVVLFHVTASPDWSTLPLSGLFVQMLERLAIGAGSAEPAPEDMAGMLWEPVQHLDAFGTLGPVEASAGVDGADLAEGRAGPDLRPGIYAHGDRSFALNAVGRETELAAARWPSRIEITGAETPREVSLTGPLLLAGLGLLLADILAALVLTGRLRPDAGTAARGAAGIAALAALMLAAPAAEADDAEAFALRATSEVVLAHVRTGDARIDEIAEAGLRGLSTKLTRRTSVEPGEPIGVDLESDELAFFPMLYWPITADQPTPSDAAYNRLNQYLRTGGMIVFDTRDGDMADFGSSTPEGRRLQEIAAPLDIPPLEPVPSDHVLTRTFYLLDGFPGRHEGRDVWVEQAVDAEEETAEGMPFRRLNDGVTPVVIGGHDWAAAWATDATGAQMLPMQGGRAGMRQRELAYRFGVNLVMHVLTGNYKSDQVHVPELLERLGQ